MSLFFVSVNDKSERRPKKQIPRPCDFGQEIRFSLVRSAETYSIGLDSSGNVYFWGKGLKCEQIFNGITCISSPTLIPGVSKIKDVSLSNRIAGFLCENGSVFLWGGAFSNSPSLLSQQEPVSRFCVSVKTVVVQGDFGFKIFTSLSAYCALEISGKIESICPFSDSFAILLENGDICTIKKLQCAVQFQSVRKDQVFSLAAFAGVHIVFINSGFGYFTAISDEGSVFVFRSDYSSIAPIQLPLITDSLCYACFAPSRLILLSSSGKMRVFSLNKVFSPNWDSRLHSGLVNSELEFSHASATGDDIFFIVGGGRHTPLPTNLLAHQVFYTRDTTFSENKLAKLLQGKTAPIYSIVAGQRLYVDPSAGKNAGFAPGDIVSFRGEEYRMIGFSDGSLLITSCSCPSVVSVKCTESIIFQLPLIWRAGSYLKTIQMDDGRLLTVDRSDPVMGSVSSFKTGDKVMHEKLGIGEVLGIRANSLVVKYQSGIRIARADNYEQIMKAHALLERANCSVIREKTVENQTILIEESDYGSISAGSIVVHGRLGLGKLLGCFNSDAVVRFFCDGGKVRQLESSEKLIRIRSTKSLICGFFGIDGSVLNVDICGSRVLDVVKCVDFLANCVGTSVQNLVLYETREMLLCDLGLGTLDGEISLMARVSNEGTRILDTKDGKVEVSINTDDFLRLPLLILDLISIDGRLAEVVGCRDKEIYIQFEGEKMAEPMDRKKRFDLVLRHFNIPTKRTMRVVADDRTVDFVYIQEEEYRNKWFSPCDLVEQEGTQYLVIGLVEMHDFLVQSIEDRAFHIRTLNPCGIFSTNLAHRPSFV